MFSIPRKIRVLRACSNALCIQHTIWQDKIEGTNTKIEILVIDQTVAFETELTCFFWWKNLPNIPINKITKNPWRNSFTYIDSFLVLFYFFGYVLP